MKIRFQLKFTLSRHLTVLLKLFLTTKATKRQRTDCKDIVNKTNSNLQHCLQILIVKFLCAEQSGIYQHLPQLLIGPTHSCMQWTFLPRMHFYIKGNIKWIYSYKNFRSSSVADLSKYVSKLTFDYCSWRTWGKTVRKSKCKKTCSFLRWVWYHAIKLCYIFMYFIFLKFKDSRFKNIYLFCQILNCICLKQN